MDKNMKAMVYENYGPLDGIALREVATPKPNDDQVLVQVQAAAVHVGDVLMVYGTPFPVRFMTGLIKPKPGIPGTDLCGRVIEVGAQVTRFRPGDKVFGACFGSCAELVCGSADHLAHAPERLSTEQAAGLATSGLAALRALRDVAKLQPGQKLLVNGAAGGIGMYAVQLAKAWGAEVTAVCSRQQHDLLRELGAAHVIDYTRDDFTQAAERYDVILDNVENHSLAQVERALKDRGLLICNSGTGTGGWKFWVRLLKPLVLSPFSRKSFRRYVSMPNANDLEELARLAETGVITPVVGRTFTLPETAAALAHVAAGHAHGKTIISVSV